MLTSFSAPMVPGWDIREDDDGLLVARRVADLSDYQREWGAVEEVTARTTTELIALCDAQTVVAEKLWTAESCHPRVAPARDRM